MLLVEFDHFVWHQIFIDCENSIMISDDYDTTMEHRIVNTKFDYY